MKDSTGSSSTTFGTTLQTHTEAAPDLPAITCGSVTLNRGEFLGRVKRLARYFSDLGVTAGDLVTLSLPNSTEIMEAAFAAWWIGACPQPVSHRLSGTERKAIIELAEPRLVVGVARTEACGRTTVSAAELTIHSVEGEQITCPPIVAPHWKVMTSGGSTGRPKLIVAPEPARTEALTGSNVFRLPGAGGAVLVPAPLTHSGPFGMAVTGLLRGNHVVLMQRFDALQTLELVQHHAVRWIYLVPTMMLRILRLTDAERSSCDLSSLDTVFHMAAPCPAWVKKAWIDWLGPDRILELYSSTELLAMTVITGREWLTHPGSVGRAVVGEIECRTDSGQKAVSGEIGELWMRRGPDQPAPYRYVGAESRRTDGGWESLGDLGFVDEDGYVYITDRLSDMIVVGGTNVYPAEIEAALEEHPAVRTSCVIGLPHDELGNVPHAIVELAVPVTEADLSYHAAGLLAPYKLPRSWEISEIPLRDDSGKVRRTQLRADRLTADTRDQECVSLRGQLPCT